MESTGYVIIKAVITTFIFIVFIVIIFYLLKNKELECISNPVDIDVLYGKIHPGDILTVRLSTLKERLIGVSLADFFHHVIVVKLPHDDNKYIFHTKNRGIRPLLYPNLEHNVKVYGWNRNYQIVQLKEYLSYIQHKQEYILHLQSHNNLDYTTRIEEIHNLKRWKSRHRSHCGYLIMHYMHRKGWTKQAIYPSRNIAYYTPLIIQDRLMELDNYTYEGIYRLH